MSKKPWLGTLEKVDQWRWRVPRDYKDGMRVDGLLYASEGMLDHIKADRALDQLANVAMLPGILGHSLAMPDVHWGYGFPIGGVAAMDRDEGVISPGGVGYDINCGVRLLRTDLSYEDIKPRLEALVTALYQAVPSGVGSTGSVEVLGRNEFDKVLTEGAQWALHRGFGWNDDMEVIEENGCIRGADPSCTSERAVERGMPQLGTLGSGNHFLEIQVVDEIYDERVAAAFGLSERGQVAIMIHCGSRGFGHQCCDDSLDLMQTVLQRYDIWLPDRQLACAPYRSPEAQRYVGAMNCAINYAFANRQCITANTRKAFEKIFEQSAEHLGMQLVYDVAHNIAKEEEHDVNGDRKMVLVHRKGATRAFPAGHPKTPKPYRDIGQPVLIPGSMGTASYVLVGTEGAMRETWGSTCHGAGRMMSRKAAARSTSANELRDRLRGQGVVLMASSKRTIVEETPEAYKDVDEVCSCVHEAGISRRVVRLRPVGVVKG